MGDSTSTATGRICDLEYTVIRARDALRVVCRVLDGFAQTSTVNDMDEADSAVVFGTAAILEEIAESCDRAIRAA